MLSSPGGTRNRRDQLYYLDDDIKKEKERWWSNDENEMKPANQKLESLLLI
jgi:hypothetical protein